LKRNRDDQSATGKKFLIRPRMFDAVAKQAAFCVTWGCLAIWLKTEIRGLRWGAGFAGEHGLVEKNLSRGEAHNYSMEVRSDPFESAKSHFFDTSSWGEFCDVTLTLKQALQPDRGGWVKIDDYRCRQAFRHFMTRRPLVCRSPEGNSDGKGQSAETAGRQEKSETACENLGSDVVSAEEANKRARLPGF
jgi:hypothetical protein